MQDAPCVLVQRVDEDGAHFWRVEEGRVGEYLMNVRAMGSTGILGKCPPSLLVELGQVRLILRVNDVDPITILDYDVGQQTDICG